MRIERVKRSIFFYKIFINLNAIGLKFIIFFSNLPFKEVGKSWRDKNIRVKLSKVLFLKKYPFSTAKYNDERVKVVGDIEERMVV